MTLPTQLVLRALLSHTGRELYGLEICQFAGLPSGTIHPILSRLERLGWLESRWEDADPRVAGRPRRRYYRLSPGGVEHVRTALENARTPIGLLPEVGPSSVHGGPA